MSGVEWRGGVSPSHDGAVSVRNDDGVRGGRRVRRAVRAAGWEGVVLARTRVTGHLLHPVIRWLPEAFRRLEAGWGPELDGSVLEMWETWPAEFGNRPPGPPLEIVGYVSTLRPRTAIDQAAAKAGTGMGMVVADRFTRWEMIRADAAGVWAVTDADSRWPVVRVRGRTGTCPTAGRMVLTRLSEEELFAHALATGVTPRCASASVLPSV